MRGRYLRSCHLTLFRSDRTRTWTQFGLSSLGHCLDKKRLWRIHHFPRDAWHSVKRAIYNRLSQTEKSVDPRPQDCPGNTESLSESWLDTGFKASTVCWILWTMGRRCSPWVQNILWGKTQRQNIFICTPSGILKEACSWREPGPERSWRERQKRAVWGAPGKFTSDSQEECFGRFRMKPTVAIVKALVLLQESFFCAWCKNNIWFPPCSPHCCIKAC